MTRIGLFVLLAGLLCAACGGSKKMAVDHSNRNNQQKTDSDIMVSEPCVDGNYNLLWVEKANVPVKKKLEQYSQDFRFFQTDDAKLQQALEQNFKEKSKSFELTFPVYVGDNIECRMFVLKNSETIPWETQKRTRVYTFKGQDPNKPSHTGRFDFQSDVGLRVYLQLGADNYVLEPVRIGGVRYYISYNKKNARALKKYLKLK